MKLTVEYMKQSEKKKKENKGGRVITSRVSFNDVFVFFFF